MGGCISSTNYNNLTLHEKIARSVRNCDVSKNYNVLDEIGSGAMGAVYVCTPKPHRAHLASTIHATNSKGKIVTSYALKVMNMAKLEEKFFVGRNEIMNEIYLLRRMDHPSIVR